MIKLKNIIINELWFDDVWNHIKTMLSNTWESLKSIILNIFKSESKDLLIGDETILTIPSSKIKDNNFLITEGALEAIKGNYNEALTCVYIINKNVKDELKDSINISPIYKTQHDDTIQRALYWKSQLNKSNFLKSQINFIEKTVENGSKSMANYLVFTAKENKNNIIGVWVDNLGAKEDVRNKVDIKVAIQKNDLEKEIIEGYSLKLYTSYSVGLINTSPKRLIYHFTKNDELCSAFEKNINKNVSYIKANKALKIINKKMYKAKKEKNIDLINKLREKRTELRNPINKLNAKYCYDILNPFLKNNKKEFIKNLLDMLGFNDKNTKMLMAIMDKKNAETKNLIIEEPQLDLSNVSIMINYKKDSTLITVKNNKKTIISFGFKEATSLSGSVSFKDAIKAEKEWYT